jgi:hypothetical protein
MAVDEQRRLRLYEAVKQVLGEQEAATLMEYLPPVGWADVATKRDLDAMRADMHAEIAGLRAEMHDALREQTTRLLTWMIPTWLSAVGIAVAVSQLR